MRRPLLYLLALSAPTLLLGSCSAPEQAKPQAEFRPTATIKDIMVSIIDPEADVLWNSVATIVSLIGATHSRSGLRVRSELDRGRYPSGVTVTDSQMATLCLERHRFHGDWNYTIHPAATRRHRVLVS